MTEQPKNNYDKSDMVRREAALIAGSMKLAAYRVCDPETLEWSNLQFHMTFDNTVYAVAGEEAAKLFAKFVTDTLEKKLPFPDEEAHKAIQIVEIFINGTKHRVPKGEGTISYDQVKQLAFPGSGPDYTPSCTWHHRNGEGGILYTGKSIPLQPQLIFNIISTGNA